eukprot:gene24380-biopygen9995
MYEQLRKLSSIPLWQCPVCDHVTRTVFATGIELESKLPIPREEQDRYVRKTNGKGHLKVWKEWGAAAAAKRGIDSFDSSSIPVANTLLVT